MGRKWGRDFTVDDMICLGIETTAHTFGVGIVNDKGDVLADEKSVYKPPLGAGIHPRKAAEHHYKNFKLVIERAFKTSKKSLKDVGLFAFSQGPGLPNCLTLGASVARYLSLKYEKPLIGVSHCVAHIEIGKLTSGSRDPVVVYCSGGNTQIIAYVDGRYRIFGETLDVPIGNALDVLARHLGLEMPGGPKIEALAKGGKWVDLPYVVKGMDFSFTGIVTECKRLCEKGVKERDIAYSFQETSFAMITEAAERAVAHTDKEEILVTGGVAANERLKKMLKDMCDGRGAKMRAVPMKYAGDCGSMIAWNGILAHNSGMETKIGESSITKNWRTDEVDVNWI